MRARCSHSQHRDMLQKLKKIIMYWQTSFMEIFIKNPVVEGKLDLF